MYGLTAFWYGMFDPVDLLCSQMISFLSTILNELQVYVMELHTLLDYSDFPA